MSKAKPSNLCKAIVIKFVSSSQINWGKETKIAQKLLKTYNKEDFWDNLSISFKIATLSWFLTNEGKSFLLAQEARQSIENTPTKAHAIGPVKIGEDVVINLKPKTIIDFLKTYGKT